MTGFVLAFVSWLESPTDDGGQEGRLEVLTLRIEEETPAAAARGKGCCCCCERRRTRTTTGRLSVRWMREKEEEETRRGGRDGDVCVPSSCPVDGRSSPAFRWWRRWSALRVRSGWADDEGTVRSVGAARVVGRPSAAALRDPSLRRPCDGDGRDFAVGGEGETDRSRSVRSCLVSTWSSSVLICIAPVYSTVYFLLLWTSVCLFV